VLIESPTQTISTQVNYRNIVRGLHDISLGPSSIVAVHASLTSLGHVVGGAETVVGALLAVCGTIVMPAFTYQTMVTPEAGPAINGMDYGLPAENVEAEFWQPDLKIHKDIGLIAETLRKHPTTKRSVHPVMSFIATGKHANEILATQKYDDPLAPLAWVADHNGEILMLGTTHVTNTMIHVGEQRAGRNLFTRWALTPESIVTVSWPGDSSGFNAIAPHITHIVKREQIGASTIQCIPANELVKIVQAVIRKDPTALLCSDPSCERCRDMKAIAGRST
jgi:aminoglycoside 3-N-acetyltransferase